MNDIRETRREWMTRCARGGGVAALAAMGWLLGRRAIKHPEKCNRSGRCRGCGDLEQCSLPWALNHKARDARSES